MSRQFDELIEDKFEHLGETYSLILPTSFPELVKALGVKYTIQAIIDCATHEEEVSHWEKIKEKQDGYIQEYLNSIGNFDNSVLVSNITYLAKSNEIRLGELEKMLGISTGYISRTARENASKRLSIDVVWKIAKFFEVSIDDLISHDFRIPSETADLLRKFIVKLSVQTMMDEIEWECEGGYMYECSPVLTRLSLFTEENDGTIVYHPDHLNENFKWTLVGDVFSCGSISKEQRLMIIAFQTEKIKCCHYDFIFCRKNEDGSYSWKKAFYCDDPFSRLEEQAAALYDRISRKVDEVRLDPDVRSIIQDYLS